VRTADSRVVALLLGTTLLRDVDCVTVLDLELLFPGLVLTTVLELDEELRGAVLTTVLERDEKLRGVVTTALGFVEELREEGRTAEVDRFTGEVLLTAFFTADELFLELLLRTEVVLDLLLFDPDLRCASAPIGAASIAIRIMIINFFMISTVYTSFYLFNYINANSLPKFANPTPACHAIIIRVPPCSPVVFTNWRSRCNPLKSRRLVTVEAGGFI